MGDSEEADNRVSKALRTVHHISSDGGWHTGVTDSRQDEILRIEFNLPHKSPLCTAVHKPVILPGYTFVVHGVALSQEVISYGDGTGRRWYRCEDGALLEIPGEHPVIIH